MRSAFGRAVVVAGAVVMALGSAAGAAAAKPRPPVLTFSPAPYNYAQVAGPYPWRILSPPPRAAPVLGLP